MLMESRIVRDYEKYIARQLNRGTSRQELNVSWLKKNELDLKRHVQELRDNIRSNWTTTGQELSKELRQYWPTSRPQSPARAAFLNPNGDVPSSPLGLNPSVGFPRSPSAQGPVGERTGNNVNDFITGYTLGLIGGVRSWVSYCGPIPPSSVSAETNSDTQMTKSRGGNREDSSRAPSDDDSEDGDDKVSEDKVREP